MEMIIISDVHYGAPHERDIMLEAYYKMDNVILTGDIFDRKNTLKSDLPYYDKKYEEAKEVFGERYILGNHECEKPDKYYLAKDGVLYCHGHTLFWDEKKVTRWENKKPGKSWYRYMIYRLKHLRSKRDGKVLKPSIGIKEKCLDLCKKHDCKTIVFGHTHKRYDELYKDIRIVNAPRGVSKIDL